jgi:hypothetical protein
MPVSADERHTAQEDRENFNREPVATDIRRRQRLSAERRNRDPSDDPAGLGRTGGRVSCCPRRAVLKQARLLGR